MNEKMLHCVPYTYIMQIFNIDKQAEFTKNSGLDSSIVYRVVIDQRTCNHLFLHNISGNECNQAFYPYTCVQ